MYMNVHKKEIIIIICLCCHYTPCMHTRAYSPPFFFRPCHFRFQWAISKLDEYSLNRLQVYKGKHKIRGAKNPVYSKNSVVKHVFKNPISGVFIFSWHQFVCFRKVC